MLKPKATQDGELRDALAKIHRSLEDILTRVNDANAKIDHVILTYHADRYVPLSYQPHDPFGYYEA